MKLNILDLGLTYGVLVNMPRLDTHSKFKALTLLESHWRPPAIAAKLGCSDQAVYDIEAKIQRYGVPSLPGLRRNGPRRRITPAAKESLLTHLNRHPYLFQDELAMWLQEEWDILVSRQTVNRLLKEEKLSRKKGQRIGPQSEVLRKAWQADMATNFVAEQLVFLDESLFKEQTCWRSMAMGPIGDPARWPDNMRRGATHSILPAMTCRGYLPCTAVKAGFFNTDQFITWLRDELLPHCNAFPGERSVICLDNLGIHCNARVEQLVNSKGCLIRYLPPYSPDFSPIELTFSILKAWMRRHFIYLREAYERRFEEFIRYAVEQSGCDRFAAEQFRHSAGGYKFEGDYEALLKELRHYETEAEELY